MQVCLSSAIIRPLSLSSAHFGAVAARFAGPLFMTKSLNAFEVTRGYREAGYRLETSPDIMADKKNLIFNIHVHLYLVFFW